MEYAFIQNQETQKIEKWQPWQYLIDLNNIILEYDLIYIVKASQLGISWDLGIINDWYANFNTTANCLLISQGQDMAQDLLAKVTFIHERLPDWLKHPIDRDNRELFALKGNYAEVRALASTAKAGHGFQGTLSTRDELARHEYARENFRAVARSGAKMVELSTANKDDPANYFGEKTEEIYRHPLTEKKTYPSGLELYTNPTMPGVCLVFLSWKLRPVRLEGMTLQEWWDSRVLPRYTAAEREEQFPETIEDVFRASVTRAYFEVSALDDMMYDASPPLRQTEMNTFNGLVRVYKPAIRGRRYVLFTDPSDGVGDPFVTGVMDYITGEVVCSATGKEKVDRVAEIHDYLVREYNNATNSYEYMATVGGEFAAALNRMATPTQAPRLKTDDSIDIGKKGQTVSPEHKSKIMGELAFAIAKRQIVCRDREFMQQAKMVTRNKSKDGLKEIVGTDRNLSFDWVMMMAGLWQLQKYTPQTKFKAITY